jgi:hypothetical protein
MVHRGATYRLVLALASEGAPGMTERICFEPLAERHARLLLRGVQRVKPDTCFVVWSASTTATRAAFIVLACAQRLQALGKRLLMA